MKINCSCGHTIFDQTDHLPHKGHLISDRQWFGFWDAVDAAIEQSGPSAKAKEQAVMELRQQRLFKRLWECSHCGKLYVDRANGKLIVYHPDNQQYNRVLDEKE